MVTIVQLMSIPCVYVRLTTRDTLLDVRWERLFDDLEAQLARSGQEEFAAEISDRTRREIAQVQLLDRLRRAVGTPLDLTIDGAGALQGVVRRVGQGWLLVKVASQPEVVIAAHAILAIRGLPVAAVEPGSIGVVESRLDLGHILRGIARDRTQMTVVLRNGSSLFGTVDRVGADFVDLAEHALGEPRRASDVSARRTVPYPAISVLRAT
jgi:hypothetical protein